jgi:hypothetical protein
VDGSVFRRFGGPCYLHLQNPNSQKHTITKLASKVNYGGSLKSVTSILEIMFYVNGGAGIATDWTAGVRFPGRAPYLFLLHSVQTGSGAHLASYPMSTEDSFPGGKQSEA